MILSRTLINKGPQVSVKSTFIDGIVMLEAMDTIANCWLQDSGTREGADEGQLVAL
jgi:hypothetical protein